MVVNEDTIAAISTPIGTGGIGIIRISGPDAIEIVQKVFRHKKGTLLRSVKSHTIHYGFIIDTENNETIDECLVSVMRAPKTYTRQDTVEINCHGGYQSISRTLNLLLKSGARPARPGEFTLRAFLEGRIDLTQAEAVIDLINAKTDYARKLALSQLEGQVGKKIEEVRQRLIDMAALVEAQIDFPEDDIGVGDAEWFNNQYNAVKEELTGLLRGFETGHLFRDGVSVAIIGRPNVGKSSLLNRLLQKDRAIVTDMPGTTRDIIEEYLNIKGLPVRIIDTAGIRDPSDKIEQEGVRRSLKSIESADVVLLVFDLSEDLSDAHREIINLASKKKGLIVLNKIDIVGANSVEAFISKLKEWLDKDTAANSVMSCPISALTGEGIEGLKDALFTLCLGQGTLITESGLLITNERHRDLIDKALVSTNSAMDSLKTGMPLEITALHLREALEHLGEITGIVTNEEVLQNIFSRFCIGK